MSDQDLQEKEDSAVLDDLAADFSPQEKAEYDKLAENDPQDDDEDDQLGEGYTGDGKGKKQGFFTRKRAGIGLGVAGVGAAGIIGISGFLGPTLFINHLKELILDKVGSVQMHQSRKYRQSKFTTIKNAFTREGRIGNKMIAEMQGRGYTFVFDRSTGTIKGLITPDGRHLIGDGIGIHIGDYLEKRHPFRTARWKTKRMNAFYNKFGVSRVSVVDDVPRTDGIDDPERIVNKEIAEEVVDDSPEVRTSPGDGSEGDTDEERAAHDANNTAVDEASSEIGKEVDELADKAKAGDTLGKTGDTLEKAVEQATDGYGAELFETAEQIAKGSLGSRLLSGLKSFLNPTDILDRICTLRNRLRSTQTAGRSLRALRLMRYSRVFISAADSARLGRADPKLVNELMKRVTSDDDNGNALGASPGFGYLLKNKFSKSRNNDTRNRVAVDGQVTGVYGGIKSSTDNVPGMSKCWAIQNPLLQAGVIVVVNGGKALLCAFTGGAGCAVQELADGTQVIIQKTITEAIKGTIERVFSRTFAKQAAKQLLIAAATELSFEAAMTLVQIYAEKTLRLDYTGQERGAALGDILVAGEGVSNRQRSLVAGMVPATSEQFAAAQEEYIAWKKEDTAKKSIGERLFAWNDPDSLAFATVTSAFNVRNNIEDTPSNMVAMGASLLNGSFFTKVLDTFGASASAASDDISFDEYTIDGGSLNGTRLAVDFAGNPQVIMRSDIEAIDPETNIQELISSGDIDPATYEPSSDRFKNHIKYCVDTVDIISRIEFENDASSPEKDCMAQNPITKKFKAHLAYLDMMDGLEAEFFPEEVDAANTPTQPTNTSTTPQSSDDIKKAGDTTQIPCAQGTKDLGEEDGYVGGKKYRIRLCGIPGFASTGEEDRRSGMVRVNSSVSAKWFELFNQAKRDGITLRASSSFRSMAKQQLLYNCYISKRCNGGRVAAKPGFSNHQIGFAIDVDIVAGASDPTLTTCKNNPARYPVYKWLADHAPSFTINAKVSSECWHWAAGGG